MQHESHSHELPSRGFGRNTNGLGILIVAAAAVLLALMAWWLWNSGNMEVKHYRFANTAAHGGHDDGHGQDHGKGDHGTATAAATAAIADPSRLGKLDEAGNFIYETGENIELTLPDAAGTKLTVGANSTEARLYKFLTDPASVVNEADKTQGWITCDRVYFETGKSTLTAASQQQVKNIAAILKAFPAAEVKVGGYTDNTGSADVNTKISQERADAVKQAIAAQGAANATAAEGYGPLHPIASNDTPEGRALNRRVDIRVTKK